MQELSRKIFLLTERLVGQQSISYEAQRELGEFLFEYVRGSRYFEKKGTVSKLSTSLPGTPFCVFALYESPKGLRDTIILCGHIDTVNIEEYGEARSLAFNNEALKNWLAKRFSDDSDLRQDIDSGDYYFGRGSLDMKGGLAMLIEIFLAICEKSLEEPKDAFPWNLILLLTCDEEGEGEGIRACLPYLKKLEDEENLNFRLLINADFAYVLEGGAIPIFCGTIGKVLLGISVFGTETHAGAPFEGVNASALLSAILSYLECNPRLTQHVKGEFTPPPSVLSMRGSQEEYSVKTPAEAHAYLNLFFAHSNAKKLMSAAVTEVRKATNLHLRSLRKKYNSFVAKLDEKIARSLESPIIVDYLTLKKKIKGRVAPTKAEISPARFSSSDKLLQLQGFMSELSAEAPFPTPSVILSFLPPFYAPYSMRLDPRQNKLFEGIRKFAREYQGVKLRVRHLYPYIADMSFVNLPKPERARQFLEQMPLPDKALLDTNLPLSIPAINLGPVGKGAHTAKERVFLPFLIHTLPQIYLDLLSFLIGRKVSI